MTKKIISIVALILCVCLTFSGCESLSLLFGDTDASIEYKIENGEVEKILSYSRPYSIFAFYIRRYYPLR